MDKKIRVGVASYLNTRPLTYGLQMPSINERMKLIEAYPSQLADMLVNDEIDLGLIPVASILQFKEYYVVSDYCIGAEGKVASVCLFSEVPIEQVTKIYLDYQSRTSVALLKWLIDEHWRIQPELIDTANENYRHKIKGTAAGLIIGDRALEQRNQSTVIYDLGAEWRRITGLPFVFAAWISNKKIPDSFIKVFNEANAIGLSHIDEIISAYPFPPYDLREYYTSHISYLLDDRKRKGMELFLSYIK